MTKKHFIALADVIRQFGERQRKADSTALIRTNGLLTTDLLTQALADFCASQNPRFQRGRWLAYIAGECGPNGGKR